MAIVGLTGWVTELGLKNKAFDDLKNNRYSDKAVKTILKMKEERAKVDTIYRDIRERINALIIVEGEANYAPFVNEMNTRIESYNNTIAIRRAKAKKSKEEPK